MGDDLPARLRVLITLLLSAWSLTGTARAQEYLLGEGDAIRITVFGEADLFRQTVISPLCTVDMELIGVVPACGRAASAVAAEISTRLANGFLVNPRVIVEVTEYGSQRVEVSGAVRNPGILVLTGPSSLTQVITRAGGPLDANVVEVEHVRPGQGSTVHQLSQLYMTREPVLVAGGDTVVLRQGRHVYIDGEVKTEGPVAYQEGLTLTQAITLAGGPTEYASSARAVVLNAKGERVVVRLRAVRNGRQPDLMLQPDDRVTLPRSWF